MAAADWTVRLEQKDGYRFEADFGNASWSPYTADILPPEGTGRGPNPEQYLAFAVGHCMSATLLFSLKRAKVAVSPLRTRVRLTIGKNEKGRNRVRKIEVEISTAPLRPEDAGRFDTCVATFADYCTVSGAVREGIPIEARVGRS